MEVKKQAQCFFCKQKWHYNSNRLVHCFLAKAYDLCAVCLKDKLVHQKFQLRFKGKPFSLGPSGSVEVSALVCMRLYYANSTQVITKMADSCLLFSSFLTIRKDNGEIL